jgi:AraC-like DNA-binding protein
MQIRMEIEKPYLIPSITINELAKKLLIQSRHLSQVTNESLKQSFFDFINSYRVEEAKQIMLDSSSGKRTILQVLFGVGFNSKSAFNSAFKKHTRMIPTEFKK